MNNTDLLGQPGAGGCLRVQVRLGQGGCQARGALRRPSCGAGYRQAADRATPTLGTRRGCGEDTAEEKLLRPLRARPGGRPGQAAPAEGSGHCESCRRGRRRLPLEARSSSGWPCGAETRQRRLTGGRSQRAVGGASGRWAGRSRRAEGRSTAAAFSRPVSGAEPRGWPRGGDMLTFRDNSWYQSGNSDVVRHRQRERQREKERAGTGRSSRRQWP